MCVIFLCYSNPRHEIVAWPLHVLQSVWITFYCSTFRPNEIYGYLFFSVSTELWSQNLNKISVAFKTHFYLICTTHIFRASFSFLSYLNSCRSRAVFERNISCLLICILDLAFLLPWKHLVLVFHINNIYHLYLKEYFNCKIMCYVRWEHQDEFYSSINFINNLFESVF